MGKLLELEVVKIKYGLTGSLQMHLQCALHFHFLPVVGVAETREYNNKCFFNFFYQIFSIFLKQIIILVFFFRI